MPKSWNIYFQIRWNWLYQRITFQLKNFLQLLDLYFFLSLQSAVPLVQIMLCTLLFSWCKFSNSVKLFWLRMLYLKLWGRTLKVDAPEFSTNSILVSTAKGNEGFFIWKCVGCCYEHLWIVLIGFWTGKWSVQATSGDKELTGGKEKVGWTVCGAECEY